VGGGVQTGSTRHVGHLLAYYTCPGWLWGWRTWWNEWHGKPKYSEKTCPDATLSTTNPTWPDPGLNPGRRVGWVPLCKYYFPERDKRYPQMSDRGEYSHWRPFRAQHHFFIKWIITYQMNFTSQYYGSHFPLKHCLSVELPKLLWFLFHIKYFAH
jgi:hypothetical protein